MTLGPSAPVNGCSSTPLTSGTMANFAVTINGTQIDLEFGSRPGSMLPTTWKLSGSLQGQQVEAANPSGCTTGCDGYVKGFFQGACLFNGTIEIKTGNCNHRYDFTAYKR